MADESKRKPDKSVSDEHGEHENHLCELVRRREMAKVAALSKDAKYMCHICGRGSNKADALCHPIEI
jgi:hypothetical protein